MGKRSAIVLRKTPIQIIKSSCLDNWSTFEGRRTAVMHHLGIKRKVPVPINQSKNIYTFLTNSLNDLNCYWIFYNHILQVVQDASSSNGSLVIFKNGKIIPIAVSKHSLEKQMQRTLECMVGVLYIKADFNQQRYNKKLLALLRNTSLGITVLFYMLWCLQ
ncbi:competence protein ComK [Virgibacillus byunsanensis]|uniref:Competence protein ComK n=1 Tax=Virgibacillus byunsanensis TaxID=570945 RepID=A0ABW3LFW2_9BACI